MYVYKIFKKKMFVLCVLYYSSPPYEPTSNKTKMAFWLVSNCRTHSERERYFGELMRTGLQVDVLGSCGSGDCDLECEERMAREYR